MQNLFWPVYKNLEKELLMLSDNIFFDDKQLNVYSIKIADLLVRTVIEIESLSKKIYFDNGGTKKTKPDGSEDYLYFDSDCINYLENLWGLSKKEVYVSAQNFYFSKPENNILKPLKNANKKGACNWKKAYQSVKHDRSNSLLKANLKHLIRALAALYVLNIYNKDDDEIKNELINKEDLSFSSSIFSVKKQKYLSVDFNQVNLGQCDTTAICIEKYPDETYKNIIMQSREDDKKQKEAFIQSSEFKMFIAKNPTYNFNDKSFTQICLDVGGSKFLTKILNSSMQALKYFTHDTEIVLNKGQKTIYDKV